MARQVLRVVSSAIAVALAERPEVKNQHAKVEIHEHSQSQEHNTLGFCCLKAEQDSTKKKQLLSIDYSDPATSNADPYQCELTSTIRRGDCFQGQQDVKLGEMQVWPLPDASVQAHGCEQKCKADMERYPKYHERLINQAKSDKEVEDALRATAKLGFEKDFSSEMYKIHEKYKNSLIAAAREATTAAKTSIDRLASGESSDAKELKTEFERKMKAFQTETRKIRPAKADPDGDIAISNLVNTAAGKTESALEKTVAAHNERLLDLLSTMKTEVNGFTSNFKKTFDILNKERSDAEQQAQDTLAQETHKLAEQNETEQNIINQLATQEPVLQGTTAPEDCSNEECCCTIKFNEKEGMNVKVATTNFLNWDICQYPGVVQRKKGWFKAKLICKKEGFLTDCDDCKQRPACAEKGNCVSAAMGKQIG